MKTWFLNRWDALRASFWFVPTLMAAGAVMLSQVTLQLDKAAGADNWLATLGWTFTRGPEGSRGLLSAVAGSMMTITSVTFSITIVSLQLATSQFGPRLLRNFMRDLGNQMSLGTFIATFAYTLLILRTVNGTADQIFVPHLSVTVGLLLAMVSLGVLIYFIHHTAASIDADQVISSVGRELDEAIDRLFPPLDGAKSEAPTADLPEGFRDGSRAIPAPGSDYLQDIDVDGLMGLAGRHDLVIRVGRRPGDFVLRASPLVLAWPADRVDDEVAGAIAGKFYLGRRRTLTQDVEFAIDQLVEIALRALSPGINDTFTAITCVDRLGAGLAHLAERDVPSGIHRDEAGRLRVVLDVPTPAGLIDAALHQVRQAARGNAAVTMRMLETIASVARTCPGREEFRRTLATHAELIARGRDELPDPRDRAEVEGRYQSAREALGAA